MFGAAPSERRAQWCAWWAQSLPLQSVLSVGTSAPQASFKVLCYAPVPPPTAQILDFFADPTYMSEFHTLLFLQGYAAGSGTAAGVPDLLPLWNAYAKHGIVHNDTSWAGNTVPEQLKASGLDGGRFRGDGEEGSFAALPGVAINLALRNKVDGSCHSIASTARSTCS